MFSRLLPAHKDAQMYVLNPPFFLPYSFLYKEK